jgi:hypothetical protein
LSTFPQLHSGEVEKTGSSVGVVGYCSPEIPELKPVRDHAIFTKDRLKRFFLCLVVEGQLLEAILWVTH